MEAVAKESDMMPQFLSAVTSRNVGRVTTALMRISERDVRFQLDGTADVNTICEEASATAIKAETDQVEWLHNEATG